MRFGLIHAAFFGLSFLGTSARAFAQDDATPAGTLKADPASAGKTDVATTGFEGAAKHEDADVKPETKDATDLKINAGGLAAGGNSRSLAMTAGETFRIRRNSEQLSIAAAANYAQAGKVGVPVTESVENFQGKARYDHFFVGSLAGFLGVSARHDRFQKLDLRLNIDPGVAYYFIDEKKQLLWAELGYDLQYDIVRKQAVDDAFAAGTPIDRTKVTHGARAFVGYVNKLNDNVQFNTDLEYVQSLQNSDHFRINWDAGIAASVSDNFSIGTTLLLQYDNAPIQGVESTDYTMSVSLIYKLL